MRITTLVPAYKSKYLVELLTAFRHQTVKPSRIIFSDDSPDRAFMTALSTEPLKSLVADMNIEVVEGPRTGAWNNFKNLLRLYAERSEDQTELFHLQLDDDIPYPTFYQRHIEAHGRSDVQCVVSRRWAALESGQPIKDNLPVPSAISDHGLRMLALDANVLFPHTLGTSSNWLGEFSNATFRASMAREIEDPSMDGICYTGLEDLGSFLKASLHAPIGYINDYLGFFRTSPEQHSADQAGRPLKLAVLAYIALAIAGKNMGRLTELQCATALARVCPVVQHYFGNAPDLKQFCMLLPALSRNDEDAKLEFLNYWHRYCNPEATGESSAKSAGSPAITVVIPVFNGEAYLSKTLDSLLAQTFQDFEVVCMDDCSTDRSLDLLTSYSERDARIRVLRMAENQGSVSRVINKSLPEMRGQYFVYSSQDDLFSVDWLSKMYSRALETGADAVIPEVVFYHEDAPELCRSLVGLNGDRSVELSGREAVQYSLDWTIPGNALWKMQLVRRLGFSDFASNADEYSGRVFFFNCNKVVFSEGQFLYRQDNPNAITKKLTYRSFDLVFTFCRLFLFLRDNGFAPEFYAREAIKALQTLELMQKWLAETRPSLSEREIVEAEKRSVRYERILRDHGIFTAFGRA